jgi:mono/diheme cytochrome c family protein
MPLRPEPRRATREPAGGIVPAQAPPTGDSTLRLGRSLYFQICAPCHGPDASGGGPIPALKEFAGKTEDFVRTATNGRPAKGMPPFKGRVSPDELEAIRAFVQSLPK